MNSMQTEPVRPEKALWYQEVLSLDPASRIFLPYARLLAEHGRRTEALDILRAGLARHPEYLEARLFFIDLLRDSGEENAAALEAAPLIESLSRCSALWDIWSRRPGVRPDVAAMLLFFGATFKEGGPSMADVFRAGLKALEEKGAASEASPAEAGEARQEETHEKQAEDIPVKAEEPADEAPEAPAAPLASAAGEKEAPADAGKAAPCFIMSEDTPWYSLDAVPDDDDIDDDEPAPEAPALSPALQELFFPASQEKEPQDEDDPAAHAVPRSALEGKSSLCTRSMARILEEQGATVEAADIYRELLESSASPEERAELNAKLDSLRQGSDNAAPAAPASSGILDMLETLAVRLENKSRA